MGKPSPITIPLSPPPPTTPSQPTHFCGLFAWIVGLAGIAQWLERWTHDRKVTGSDPFRSGGRIFFSVINFLCSYFSTPYTPILSQWHVKYPGHSAKSAGGRLQLNRHAPYVCGFAWSESKGKAERKRRAVRKEWVCGGLKTLSCLTLFLLGTVCVSGMWSELNLLMVPPMRAEYLTSIHIQAGEILKSSRDMCSSLSHCMMLFSQQEEVTFLP